MIKNNFNALTGLRGLAILIVMASHMYGRELGLYYEFINFHGMGRAGIYIFFVLSAFLCHQSFERYEKTSDYFIKRFFRIAPTYYFVITAVVISSFFIELNPRYLHINDNPLLHYFFYRGDGIFWTIPTEVFYYFLIPVLVWIGRPKAVLSLLFVVYIWQKFNLSPDLVFVENNRNTQFLEVFLLGSAAFFYRKNKLWSKLFSNNFSVYLLIAALLFGCLSMCRNVLGFQPTGTFNTRESTLLWGLVVALIVLAIYTRNELANKIFSIKPLTFFGQYAYTIYLTHMGVFQIVNGTNYTILLKILITIFATITISMIISKLIETPGIKLGDKLIKMKNKQNIDIKTAEIDRI